MGHAALLLPQPGQEQRASATAAHGHPAIAAESLPQTPRRAGSQWHQSECVSTKKCPSPVEFQRRCDDADVDDVAQSKKGVERHYARLASTQRISFRQRRQLGSVSPRNSTQKKTVV